MLDDILVLDFSLGLPGPYATMLLQACGARVISIAPPEGDPARVFDPDMVETLETGKERLTLDLRVPAAREIVHRLASRSDVLIEGFRPGVADRLGIAYDAIRTHRPDVIYCSISGFGQTGPYRVVAGHDINYLGVSGGLDGAADHAARGIGIPIIDLAAGTTAAFLITAALRERHITGAGRYLDVAMLDCGVFWSCLKAHHGAAGTAKSQASRREPTYGVLRAADGKDLTLGVVEDKFWKRLCAVLGWDEWGRDPRLARYSDRRRHGQEIFARLREAILCRPREEWLRLLWEADVPAAPVNSYDEVPNDPQVVERELFTAGPNGRPRLRAPIPASGVPAARTWRTPEQAQQAVLQELGYDRAAQEALAAAGSFGGGLRSR